MINLLNADFVRLRKSKLFWLFLAAAFLWSVTMCFMIDDGVKTFGERYLTTSGGLYVLMPLFYIAPAEAIFCGFFIGTDYSDGTIRNKILIGCRRRDVYLSNFIISCFAGLMLCAAHLAAAVIVGLPLVGTLIFTSVPSLILKFLCGALIVALIAAIFTLLCMLNSNKTAAVTVGIILSFVLIFAGTVVFAGLSEPEYYNRYVITDEGEEIFETAVPNPQYVDSPVRDVLEWVDAAIPMSASLDIMVPTEENFSARIPICSAALTFIITAAGMAAFEKKDIK